MVKKYSKKTFKRKNKISRRKSSKRKHRRNKKKTKKKKHKNYFEDDLKAGMKNTGGQSLSSTATDYAAGVMEGGADEGVPPELRLDEGVPPELDPHRPQQQPTWGERSLEIIKTKRSDPLKKIGQVKTLNRLLNMPSNDRLTVSRVNHNSLDSIKDKINNSECDTVYVLLISNHGSMMQPVSLALRTPGSRTTGYDQWIHGGRSGLFVPQNFAIVFNILPGHFAIGEDPNIGMRNHSAEDLILKAISDNIENYENLDNLFESDGCLSESGERLNSGLTKIDHYNYNILGEILETPQGKSTTMISESEDEDKKYGILNKLQVYKQGENYSNMSFGSDRDEDKNILGLLFKFKKSGGFVYYYYNLLDGGYEFSDAGVATLSNILSHIKPLEETGKKFIITHRSCRDSPSDFQRTSSREHGNSDSIDCYIKKFHPSNRSRIKETIEDLGFENMIDFYENLEYLDYFVKLEEEGKIISFFRDLATEKGITDQWLGLAKKERRNPPPAGYRSPPPRHTPSAATLAIVPGLAEEDDFLTGVPPVPD